MKGEQITSLAMLARAADQKRAVIGAMSHRPESHLPAIFVLNMSGWKLHIMIRDGLYLCGKRPLIED